MEKFSSPATMQNLGSAMEFIVETSKKHFVISKKTESEIRIIAEEILVNIISYAYDEKVGDMFVECDFDIENRQVNMIFSDYGIAYNPLENEEPDITLGIMERKIGGLGIFMVKKLSDDISYERKNNMNILAVKKNIN